MNDNMPNELLRVAIVEDQRLHAELARKLFENDTSFRVIGVATSFAAGLELCRVQRPDVVLVDHYLGDGDGCELVRVLRQELPASRWLLISGHLSTELVETAESVGAQGLLDKTSAGLDDLRRAIRLIADGRQYYAQDWPERVMHSATRFTKQERTTLTMLARHRTRADIARELDVSRSRITRIVTDLAVKLAVPLPVTTSDLIASARRAGILPMVPE